MHSEFDQRAPRLSARRVVGLQQTWMCQWSQRARGGGDDFPLCPIEIGSASVASESRLTTSSLAKFTTRVNCS